MEKIIFNNSFTSNLTADSILDNYVRMVENAHFSYVKPKQVSNPKLLHFSPEVGLILNIENQTIQSPEFVNIFSGNQIASSSKPYAMNYAGHQFGHWAGQLGDGRAINLGEINNYTLQLKGAGPTPYSRRADGLAVLRSSIREHLCSEAMYYLGVPTTRSLCLIETGDLVTRDIMYNGNPKEEKGAIVCRVAPSFIRFGNFEILSARQETENLKLLADYTITNYFPEITSDGKQKYIDFYYEVSERTRKMVIEWLRVGFVHGVMNTDNMSILGLTIDYGPYGWMDNFDFDWTPNTTDAEGKRYRFGNQANICLWNLMQLANALYPLINETKPFEEILQSWTQKYDQDYESMMHHKLGIYENNNDQLIMGLIQCFHYSETDMTIFFRELGQVKKEDSEYEMLTKINIAFYNALDEQSNQAWLNWLTIYKSTLNQESYSNDLRKKKMNEINPKYVLRNYMAQIAIEEAEKGNYQIIDELFNLLKKPYTEQPEFEKWYNRRPDWAKHKIGCSMLSCSS